MILSQTFNLETMNLLGSNKSKITKDKKGENEPNLEITEVVLVHCNIVNNNYQQDSRVLYTFSPNKSFGQSLDISPKNLIFLKTINSEFLYIEIWFTDQNSKLLEIEGKMKIILVNNYSVKYKKCIHDIQFNLEKEYCKKAMNFCLFRKIWVKISIKI